MVSVTSAESLRPPAVTRATMRHVARETFSVKLVVADVGAVNTPARQSVDHWYVSGDPSGSTPTTVSVTGSPALGASDEAVRAATTGPCATPGCNVLLVMVRDALAVPCGTTERSTVPVPMTPPPVSYAVAVTVSKPAGTT